MLGHDDPEHRRLRGLVDQAFQRRTIQAMKPMITEVADRLLDRLKGKTEVDLMAEYCRDLPLSVICAMLGLPERDHDRFKQWLGGLKDTANIGAVIRAIPGVIRVVRYLRRVSRPEAGPFRMALSLPCATHRRTIRSSARTNWFRWSSCCSAPVRRPPHT
jgi:cytochrome P450